MKPSDDAEGDSISARNPYLFVGDNDHGDAVPRTNPRPDLNPTNDIAIHLRYETKRTDLPNDVIVTMARAYARIDELERRLNVIERHAKHMKIADCIVSSEPFGWLMVGSNHVQSNLAMLREVYEKWREAGGQTFLKQSNQYLDELAKLDEELGLTRKEQR